MNGTALNDLTISTPDRTPGDRHAVNPGDSIILAERITISVKLLDLFNTHTDQDPESSTYHKGICYQELSVTYFINIVCLLDEYGLFKLCLVGPFTLNNLIGLTRGKLAKTRWT